MEVNKSSNLNNQNELQQLWQQTTTNESFTLKERAMLREIQHDMDSFDEKFGFRTTKQLNSVWGNFSADDYRKYQTKQPNFQGSVFALIRSLSGTLSVSAMDKN